jgi:hypothetical protein
MTLRPAARYSVAGHLAVAANCPKVATGSNGTLIPPCLFCTENHEWNTEGRANVTPPPAATPRRAARAPPGATSW